MMNLRIRHPPDNPIIKVSPDDTFKSLRLQISEIVGTHSDNLIIKSGYPPLEILAGDSSAISDVLKDGDLITPQQTSLRGVQVSSDAPPPKQFLKRSQLPPEPLFQNDKKNSESRLALDRKRPIHTLSSAPISLKAPKRRKGKIEMGGSEDDWATNLLEAFSSSSGSLTSAQKALRGVFRNAVGRRAASTLAENRWTSVQGGTYVINQVPPSSAMKFTVSFPIGLRSDKTEEYLNLPKVLLSTVLKEVYNSGEDSRNNLRPYYMSEGHPLIFWNLVKHFNGDFQLALKELCPDVDWTFTEERERKLSAKAAENLRQKEEASSRKRASVAGTKVEDESLAETPEKKAHQEDTPDEEHSGTDSKGCLKAGHQDDEQAEELQEPNLQNGIQQQEKKIQKASIEQEEEKQKLNGV